MTIEKQLIDYLQLHFDTVTVTGSVEKNWPSYVISCDLTCNGHFFNTSVSYKIDREGLLADFSVKLISSDTVSRFLLCIGDIKNSYIFEKFDDFIKQSHDKNNEYILTFSANFEVEVIRFLNLNYNIFTYSDNLFSLDDTVDFYISHFMFSKKNQVVYQIPVKRHLLFEFNSAYKFCRDEYSSDIKKWLNHFRKNKIKDLYLKTCDITHSYIENIQSKYTIFLDHTHYFYFYYTYENNTPYLSYIDFIILDFVEKDDFVDSLLDQPSNSCFKPLIHSFHSKINQPTALNRSFSFKLDNNFNIESITIETKDLYNTTVIFPEIISKDMLVHFSLILDDLCFILAINYCHNDFIDTQVSDRFPFLDPENELDIIDYVKKVHPIKESLVSLLEMLAV